MFGDERAQKPPKYVRESEVSDSDLETRTNCKRKVNHRVSSTDSREEIDWASYGRLLVIDCRYRNGGHTSVFIAKIVNSARRVYTS